MTATRRRYVPDLAGYPFAKDPQGGAVLRRNLEMIASAMASGGGKAPAMGVVIGSGNSSGSSPGEQDHVSTKHLTSDWNIYERVAITRVVQENASASIIFGDADTILVEIGG